MAELVGPIQHKRGTTAQWASSTVPLRDGELGIDTTLRRMKVGDGSTLFPGLPWASTSAADVARLEAAATALEGATAPTDAAMTTIQANPASAFAQAQKATIGAQVDASLGKAASLPNVPRGTLFYDTPAPRPLSCEQRIAYWGHSLVFSNGGKTQAALSDALGGVEVLSATIGGVGGETSTDIAIRQGGIIPLVTVSGGQIPTSGPVSVTVKPTGDYRQSGNATPSRKGTLAGVFGTLAYTIASKSWTFTRAASGGAVTVAPDTQFVGEFVDTYGAWTTIVLPGRNNTDGGNRATILRDLDAMIGRLLPYDRRFLVLSDIIGTEEGTNATTDAWTRDFTNATNEARRKRYSNRTDGVMYYDINADFQKDGLTLAGITPTSQDTANLAVKAAPPSLMGDKIHPNDAGYAVMGRLIARFLATKTDWGYTEQAPPTTIASDSFNRANATSLGSTDSAYGGSTLAWSAGDMSIINGQIGRTSGASGTQYVRAELSTADARVTATIAELATVSGVSLLARFIDFNNFVRLVINEVGGMSLTQNVNGSSAQNGAQIAAGTVKKGSVVSLAVSGAAAKIYVDGVLVAERTLATVTTGTQFGLVFPATPVPRIDDVKFTSR